MSPDPIEEDLPLLGFLDIHTVTVSAVTGKKGGPPPGKGGPPPGKGDPPPGKGDPPPDPDTDPPPDMENTQARKDGSENAINLDYDLYSMGPDGATDPSLSSQPGYDDIIRGSSGGYFGPANNY